MSMNTEYCGQCGYLNDFDEHENCEVCALIKKGNKMRMAQIKKLRTEINCLKKIIQKRDERIEELEKELTKMRWQYEPGDGSVR